MLESKRLHSAVSAISTLSIIELINSLGDQLGPALITSMWLFYNAICQLNEFNYSMGIAINAVPNLAEDIQLMAEGRLVSGPYPGFEYLLNRFYGRNNLHLYETLLYTIQAFSVPQFNIAINTMSSNVLEQIFAIVDTFLGRVEDTFNHAYNVYPVLESFRRFDAVRTSSISSGFMILYYLGIHMSTVFDRIRERLVSLNENRSETYRSSNYFVNFTIPASEFPHISSRRFLHLIYRYEAQREIAVENLRVVISDIETMQAEGHIVEHSRELLEGYRRDLIEAQNLLERSRINRDALEDLSRQD